MSLARTMSECRRVRLPQLLVVLQMPFIPFGYARLVTALPCVCSTYGVVARLSYFLWLLNCESVRR